MFDQHLLGVMHLYVMMHDETICSANLDRILDHTLDSPPEDGLLWCGARRLPSIRTALWRCEMGCPICSFSHGGRPKSSKLDHLRTETRFAGPPRIYSLNFTHIVGSCRSFHLEICRRPKNPVVHQHFSHQTGPKSRVFHPLIVKSRDQNPFHPTFCSRIPLNLNFWWTNPISSQVHIRFSIQQSQVPPILGVFYFRRQHGAHH